MKKNTEGFYALEAALFLPVVILAVLTLGYFIKAEGIWENCTHGAADESSLLAVKAYDSAYAAGTGTIIKKRLEEDNPQLDSIKINNVRVMYSDSYTDDLVSYSMEIKKTLAFPLGFTYDFKKKGQIKFRCFTGVKVKGTPMGKDGLENEQQEDCVWIFPLSGEKYHDENCTYVKAAVYPKILTERIKQDYRSCSICGSENIAYGRTVFCFEGEGTAYHRSTCRIVDRKTMTIDRTEAKKKGYMPCSKCGG